MVDCVYGGMCGCRGVSGYGWCEWREVLESIDSVCGERVLMCVRCVCVEGRSVCVVSVVVLVCGGGVCMEGVSVCVVSGVVLVCGGGVCMEGVCAL